jgi:UDP-glucose 4-epimerase
MRSVVTGGAGFIGSHLVEALVAAGDDVLVLDDLSSGREEHLAGVLGRGAVLREADVRDADVVARLCASHRPERVFHLAAQIDVRRSVEDPGADARINVEGTINALEAARAAGARRFVQASTGGAIYGEAEVLPTPEEAPARPISPYGQSKLAAEGYVRLYAELHGLPGIALRLGNIYGPRQGASGETGVIGIFCRRLLAGADPVVFGDGRQTRDYVFVGDVVRAMLAAASSTVEGVVNIGRGEETSVNDLIDVLRPLGQGEAFSPGYRPERAGEVQRSCLDPARAGSTLGWRPGTGLCEGLRATLDFERTQAPV